jgi:hypothetical protein
VRIVLSDHAEKRMRERVFSIADIQNVVKQPNVKVMRADGRVEYVGMTSGRTLKLVIDEQQDPAVLVTAFWQ